VSLLSKKIAFDKAESKFENLVVRKSGRKWLVYHRSPFAVLILFLFLQSLRVYCASSNNINSSTRFIIYELKLLRLRFIGSCLPSPPWRDFPGRRGCRCKPGLGQGRDLICIPCTTALNATPRVSTQWDREARSGQRLKSYEH